MDPTIKTIEGGKTVSVSEETSSPLVRQLAGIFETQTDLVQGILLRKDGSSVNIWREVPSNVPPIANITSPVVGPLTYTASATGSADGDGRIVTYLWSWGDGTTTLTQNAGAMTHLYSAPGTYTVKLTVTDDNGASATVTANANIPGAPTPTAGAKFPCDVAVGAVRWGAAIDGNADPAYHETPAGAPMGVRRTYMGGSDTEITKLINMAKNDLAKDRTPWVSFKPFTGSNWTTIGEGKYDAKIDQILNGLKALNGNVMLTFHHEPENDDFTSGPAFGGAPAWRAAQKRIRDRMTALGVKNVAFGACLMAYTCHTESRRNPEDWWVPGIWDFMGVDAYEESAASAGLLTQRYWTAFITWVAKKGIKVAIGEWGNRGTDAAAAAEMQKLYDYCLQPASTTRPQIIAAAYFDSGLNAPTGSWELAGEPLTKFRELMKKATSLQAREYSAL